MFEVISDQRTLVDLEQPWTALAAQSDNPFLRHDCAVACAEVYGRSARLAVLVVRSGGDITAIAPFRAVRRAGLERLEMLTRPLWEPTGFLFADSTALEQLVDGLLGLRRPLALGRLPVDSPEWHLLHGKLANSRILSTAASDSRSLWLPLCADWSQVEAGMSTSRRSTLRRMLRSAERRATVAFDPIIPDESNLDPLLREAYRVEGANWKGRNGSAIVMMPIFKDVFPRWCRALTRLGRLRLFFLRIGGEIAAVRISVEHRGRLSDLKIGYDERFQDYSPGIVLTHLTLRHCCDQGLTAFEFMGQSEAWEEAWAPRVRHYATLSIRPWSLGGALALAQDTTWRLAKQTLAVLKLDKEARKARARRTRPAPEPAAS